MNLHFKKIKTEEIDVLEELHKDAFPGEDVRDFSKDTAWIVLDGNKNIVGFCSVAPLIAGEAFLSRSASFQSGAGIHRASIRYRLRWLKRNGFKVAVTYTSVDNFKSISGLIRCGFLLYQPEWDYAGKGFLYFKKKL